MECLEELSLDGTRIKILHPSIENLIGLKSLSLQNCQNLEKLPSTIFNMQSLIPVNINDCSKLKLLPKLPFSIKRLDARGCNLLERPSNPLFLDEEKLQIHVEQHLPRHLNAKSCKSVERAWKPWIAFAEELSLDQIDVVAEFLSRVLDGDGILVSSEPKVLLFVSRHDKSISLLYKEYPLQCCSRSSKSHVRFKI